MTTAEEHAQIAENTADNIQEPDSLLEGLRGITDGLFAVAQIGLAIYKTLERQQKD